MITPTRHDPAPPSVDTLVVGGGPAGYASAIVLGRRGHRVTVVDRGASARQPSVLLAPRAVAASRALGLDTLAQPENPSPLEAQPVPWHRLDQVKLTDFGSGRSTTTRWPATRDVGDAGCVGRRETFVGELRRLADDVGVVTMAGCEAVEPIVERGFVRGAHVRDHASRVREVRATYTIVADGPNSTFGRLLGTFREPAWPIAVAQAADYPSPCHDEDAVEIVLGFTDLAGTPIIGYGWTFPTGAGSVSVGVMLASTSPSFHVINPSHLFDRFVGHQRSNWQLDGAPVTPSSGGRVPMGSSVGPLAGPTYLIVGDAGGAANPLTGMGIETALETGTMAGEIVGDALDTTSAAELQHYPKRVADRYAAYYKVGRLTDRLISQPTVARRVFSLVTSRQSIADGALRIATQQLRGVRGGGPELAYRVARALSAVAPEA